MLNTLPQKMKKAGLLTALLIAVSVLLSSCSSVSIDNYENAQPKIKLDRFFDGELAAYGIVRNRSGEVIRHFNARLLGSWENGVGTLDEVFWFNDGERQTRIWTMQPEKDGSYTGTAGDVEGKALIQAKGNAINLRYKLRIPYNDSEITLSMDDWMYQITPGVVINETMMYKWGLHVGTVTLVIIQQDAVDTLFNFPVEK